jgi:hypothetical protein
MADLVERIRIRLIPALLTALGVAALAAGMLSLTAPVTADPLPSASAAASATPSSAPTPSALITLPPIPSDTTPSASPSFPADRVATRVRVAALDIDLPVVLQPGEDYPWCNVAMYIDELDQPGQGGATYLYAHARTGMFLPILEESLVDDGASMLGMVVEVWTSDNQRFLYEITEVRRHQTVLTDAQNADSEEVWLQTSEGPRGTAGKTQVIAHPLSQEAADPADAHPEADPVVCG